LDTRSLRPAQSKLARAFRSKPSRLLDGDSYIFGTPDLLEAQATINGEKAGKLKAMLTRPIEPFKKALAKSQVVAVPNICTQAN
jgi:hypothetical protein